MFRFRIYCVELYGIPGGEQGRQVWHRNEQSHVFRKLCLNSVARKVPYNHRATNETKTEPRVSYSGLNAFFSESGLESDFQTSGLNRPNPRDPRFSLADAFNNLALELRRDKPPGIPKPTLIGKVHKCPFMLEKP